MNENNDQSDQDSYSESLYHYDSMNSCSEAEDMIEKQHLAKLHAEMK